MMDFKVLTELQREFLRHRCLGKTVVKAASDMELTASAAQGMMTTIINLLGVESVFERDAQIVKICVAYSYQQGYRDGTNHVLDEIDRRIKNRQKAA